MQKKRDVPSDLQLELEFAALVVKVDAAPTTASNVVQVQFRRAKTAPLSCDKNEQQLINRILQSAQKLKW
jgi:hypothetical protein